MCVHVCVPTKAEKLEEAVKLLRAEGRGQSMFRKNIIRKNNSKHSHFRFIDLVVLWVLNTYFKTTETLLSHHNCFKGGRKKFLTVCPWNVLIGLSCPNLQTWMHISVLQEAKVLLLCQSTSNAGAAKEKRPGLYSFHTYWNLGALVLKHCWTLRT